MSALFHQSVFHDYLAKRYSDVAAKVRLSRKSTGKYFISETCRGRFAVGARYGNIMLRLCDLIGKLNFRYDGDTALGKFLHHRASVRNSRILDNKVKITLEHVHILSDNLDSVFVEEVKLLDVLFFLAFRKRYICAELFQHPDRRHTASRKSDDENPFT